MRNYEIIILGPRSSGKTLLLASMYYQVSIPEKYKIFLRCDETTTVTNTTDGRKLTPHMLLTERYTKLADTSADWEPGTVDVEKWHFTCEVQRPDLDFQTYTACNFIYYDYAGGNLDQIENLDLQEKIKNADSLLGLLDGEKILSLMQGEDAGLNKITKDFAIMLPLMIKQKNPVHFVISKWDLLEGLFSLEMVRDRLLKYKKFRDFIKNRREGNSIVRLIPVSAVGLKFARLENGIMKKIPGSILKPFLVEMPLACVLPDQIKSELQQIYQKRQELERQKIDYTPSEDFWDSVFNLIGTGLDWVAENIVLDLPPKLRVAGDILKKVSQAAKAGATKSKEEQANRIRELERKRTESLMAVKNEETALNYAIDVFLEMQAKLDLRFPASQVNVPNNTEKFGD